MYTYKAGGSHDGAVITGVVMTEAAMVCNPIFEGDTLPVCAN